MEVVSVSIGGQMGFGITIRAEDLASGVLADLAKSFDKLDASIREFAKQSQKNVGHAEQAVSFSCDQMLRSVRNVSAGIAAAGIAGLVGVLKLTDSGGRFEAQLAEISATSNITTVQVDELKSKILDLGRAGKIGPEEAATMFRELANTALSGRAALDSLVPAVNLLEAALGRLSPEQTGGLVAKTLAAFPQYAGNATEAVNLLARAISGGLKPEYLHYALDQAAKGARHLGYSLQEVLATVGAAQHADFSVSSLSKETLSIARATPNFVLALGKMNEKLNDVSVTAESLAKTSELSWDRLREEIGKTVKTIETELGGSFISVLRSGLIVLRDIAVGIAKGFGSLPEPVKKVIAGLLIFGSVAAAIGGTVAALAASVAMIGTEAIVGALVAAGAAISGLVQIVIPAGLAIYAFYKAWTTNFAGIRDVVLPIIDDVRIAVESLFQLFTEGEITGALADDLLKEQNKGLFTFVENVSEVVTAVQAFFQSLWTGIRPDLIKVGESLGDTFSSLGRTFRSIFSAMGDVFNTFCRIFSMGTNSQIEDTQKAGAVIGKILGALLRGFAYFGQKIAYHIEGSVGMIAAIVKGVAKVVEGVVWIVGVLAQGVVYLIEGVTGPIGLFYDFIVTTGHSIADTLGSWYDKVASAAKGVLTTVFEGGKSIVRSFLNTVITGINAAIDGINRLGTLATEIPGIGKYIPSFSIAHLPLLAADVPAVGESSVSTRAPSQGSPAPWRRGQEDWESMWGRSASSGLPSSRPLNAPTDPVSADAGSTQHVAGLPPVQMSGTLYVDGKKLGTWQAQEDRDRMASSMGKRSPMW